MADKKEKKFEATLVRGVSHTLFKVGRFHKGETVVVNEKVRDKLALVHEVVTLKGGNGPGVNRKVRKFKLVEVGTSSAPVLGSTKGKDDDEEKEVPEIDDDEEEVSEEDDDDATKGKDDSDEEEADDEEDASDEEDAGDAFDDDEEETKPAPVKKGKDEAKAKLDKAKKKARNR